MFKLPKKVIEDMKGYVSSLGEFTSGMMSAARFAGARVPWGIYSHRGGKVFMTRIRIPAGLVSAVQLKAIAGAARKYGNGIAHVTTRQDIQLHEVKIEDTIKAMEYLKDYDLSPRGGGGNTLRNVTACVFSGVCPEEVFGAAEYAAAITEYLMEQETSYNLPRKFKISLSGCAADCGGCLINDVGLLACEKDGVKGFKVFAGGGMGAESRIGKLLEDFIPREEAGYCVTAVKNVYYKNGDRRNKHHNRLRFLIGDMGWEKFEDLYREEVKSLKESEHIFLRIDETPSPASSSGEIPKVDDREFKEFCAYSIFSQKQKGLLSVELRIPKGDITAGKLEKLADMEIEFPGIEFRTTPSQNLHACNVRNVDLHRFFLKIKGILADFIYPSTFLDVVCCKGALTCNLGLCNSPGLADELDKVIKENFIGTPVFKKLNIKINGCPNACGQHPIGNIGLHGMVKRVSNRPVPFYKLLLGGRVALLDTRLAKDTHIAVPARSVPLFLKDFLERINKEIDGKTDIHKFIVEKGETIAKEIIAKYSYVPPFSENRDFYVDWGKTEEFSLDGLGPGECGAGVISMIEADLSDAKISLEKAQKNNFAAAQIRHALFFSARSLLIVKGSDPKDEPAAFEDFNEKFIKEGIAPERFSDAGEVYSGTNDTLSSEEREKAFVYAKEFYETVKGLYKCMDPTFNFPKQKVEAKGAEPEKKIHLLDLKGVQCPMNYVKAKIFLEKLKSGDIVEIYLDEGEPIDNVPRSLKSDGHQIVGTEKQPDNHYKVTVKKG